MSNFSRSGVLFVLSAPSGTGKSTLRQGLARTPDFVFSVSCTTRPPRPGEVDGVDYRFLTLDDFQTKIHQGAFLEYARVHGDHYYGTLRHEVTAHLAAGTDVLLDIDVQGARQIRTCQDPAVRAAVVDVFVMPPTWAELENRLRKRGTETEDQVARRLATAREEMKFWPEYRYTILSGSMEEDLEKFRAIMRAERLASHRLRQDKPLGPLDP
ncbi:MAG: guanylate kinase [Verrucomicrobiia bacterium]